ncbi:hypothetical protein, partial [Pseudomonas aeruginosa]
TKPTAAPSTRRAERLFYRPFMHACIPTDWSQRMIHQITRAGKSLLAAGCTLSILFASDS